MDKAILGEQLLSREDRKQTLEMGKVRRESVVLAQGLWARSGEVGLALSPHADGEVTIPEVKGLRI